MTLTPQEEIEVTLEAIDDLVDAGAVPSGPAQALQATLEGADRQLDAGRVGAAIGQLQAFIAQVNALVQAGSLSAADGRRLIDAANATLASLG